MQGGFAFGKITEKGVELGQAVDLPVLDGERTFMRPLIGFTPKFAVLIAASEDDDFEQPATRSRSMFLVDKATGQLVKPQNSKRPVDKPIDLVSVAQQNGINVDNPNNQRGPHMIVPVGDNSFLVGMQYNNQAQEVFRVTVGDDAKVTMNWLQRSSNNAVHNRPQVTYSAGAAEGFVSAVECNAQPANIGLRLTKFDVNTGKSILSKVVVKADPDKNKYVAEPHIVDLGDKIGMVYAYSAKARNRDGNNGHAGGANVSQVSLFSKADLAQVGDTLMAPANYQRHPGAFALKYGAEGTPAIGVISGSSTGTSKGLLQIIPLKADGLLSMKDPMKAYTVSTYSDVANLQARGKRNPNNQAKGFINGLGDVPNPGFDKPGGFYPPRRRASRSPPSPASRAPRPRRRARRRASGSRSFPRRGSRASRPRRAARARRPATGRPRASTPRRRTSRPTRPPTSRAARAPTSPGSSRATTAARWRAPAAATDAPPPGRPSSASASPSSPVAAARLLRRRSRDVRPERPARGRRRHGRHAGRLRGRRARAAHVALVDLPVTQHGRERGRGLAGHDQRREHDDHARRVGDQQRGRQGLLRLDGVPAARGKVRELPRRGRHRQPHVGHRRRRREDLRGGLRERLGHPRGLAPPREGHPLGRSGPRADRAGAHRRPT